VKICYLADAANVHTQKWASFFAQRGNEVCVISFLPAVIPGIKVYHIHPPFGKLGYLLSTGRISNLIRQISPNLLHAQHATSYGFVGALSGYHPYIISSWGSDVIWSPQRSFIFRWILRYNFQRADFVTATSRMLADTTAMFCPPNTKVHVIPFGVDTNTFSPISSNEEKKKEKLTVGIVKTMRPRYGIRELILAFQKVSKDFPTANLIIVGGGEQLSELRAMVKDLNMETCITLTGLVNHSQITKYLHNFDVFVVPSLTNRESFGVAAVEASACGLPVIASNVGGLPEVVLDGETGLLVPPGNIDALAQAISCLLANPALRNQMGQAGRQFVLEHYRWEDNAKLMEDLYKDILRKN
jgi:glycosyltransferase involved in cell wall biosynthesis